MTRMITDKNCVEDNHRQKMLLFLVQIVQFLMSFLSYPSAFDPCLSVADKKRRRIIPL